MNGISTALMILTCCLNIIVAWRNKENAKDLYYQEMMFLKKKEALKKGGDKE